MSKSLLVKNQHCCFESMCFEKKTGYYADSPYGYGAISSARGKKYAGKEYSWCAFCKSYTPSYRGTKLCVGHAPIRQPGSGALYKVNYPPMIVTLCGREPIDCDCIYCLRFQECQAKNPTAQQAPEAETFCPIINNKISRCWETRTEHDAALISQEREKWERENNAPETKQAYRNGFDEGFEIGKAQCETHHQEIKEEAAAQAREDVLKELKEDLKSRFISSTNQWSKGRNSGLLECCNIIDDSLRSEVGK